MPIRTDETLVGFSLSGNDNNTWMWDESDPRVARCPVCHYRTDFFSTNPDYVTKKRFRAVYAPELSTSSKTAVASTYDGQTIVNQSFKDFSDHLGYADLKFVPFDRDMQHYHLLATKEVRFDVSRHTLRFEQLCAHCGNFDSVVPAHPTYIQVREALADGFFRTDLLFGGGNGKSPLILVGIDTHRKLKESKFKGLSFHPVYGLHNP